MRRISCQPIKIHDQFHALAGNPVFQVRQDQITQRLNESIG
jgi:hypothetical protein